MRVAGRGATGRSSGSSPVRSEVTNDESWTTASVTPRPRRRACPRANRMRVLMGGKIRCDAVPRTPYPDAGCRSPLSWSDWVLSSSARRRSRAQRPRTLPFRASSRDHDSADGIAQPRLHAGDGAHRPGEAGYHRVRRLLLLHRALAQYVDRGGRNRGSGGQADSRRNRLGNPGCRHDGRRPVRRCRHGTARRGHLECPVR